MSSRDRTSGILASVTTALRRHWLAWVVAVSALSFVPKLWMSWRNYVRFGPYDQSDFNLYYFSFDTILHRLHDLPRLYDHAYLIEQMARHGIVVPPESLSWFGYPPSFAVFFAPLALLDLQTAKLVWLIAAALMLGASFAMLTRLCIGPARDDAQRVLRRRFFVLLLAITGLSAPLYMEAQFGQANCLILFLLCSSFYLKYVSGRPFLAGAPLALAILLKLTPAVIPLYFLVRRDFRLAFGTLVAGVAGVAVTASVTGWKILLLYPTVYLPAFSARVQAHGVAPWNSSIRGALSRVLEDTGVALSAHAMSILLAGISLVVLAVVLRLAWRSAANVHRDIGLAVLLPLLLTPVVEKHHVVIGLIPVAAALGALLARRPDAARVAAAAPYPHSEAVTVGMLAIVITAWAFNPMWISYTVSFAVLFIALLRATRESATQKSATRTDPHAREGGALREPVRQARAQRASATPVARVTPVRRDRRAGPEPCDTCS